MHRGRLGASRVAMLATLFDGGILHNTHLRAAEEISLIHEVGSLYGCGLDEMGATRVDQAFVANPHIRRLQVFTLHYRPWVELCHDPNGPWGRDGRVVRSVTEAIVATNLAVAAIDRAIQAPEGTAQRYCVEGLDQYASVAGWFE